MLNLKIPKTPFHYLIFAFLCKCFIIFGIEKQTVMKKIILFILSVVISVSLQSQPLHWSMGLEAGCVTNVAKFAGGDKEANALFTSELYHSGHLAFNVRYRINKWLSLQNGYRFTQLGFSYALARNYSLLKPENRLAKLNTSTCISQVPVMAIINTPADCHKLRWIFGAGVAATAIDSKWESDSKDEIKTAEGVNTSNTYMTEHSQLLHGVSGSITWLIGIEKILKKGNMIDFKFQANPGLDDIAESTVTYIVNDQSYTHRFTNKGSYVSFSFAYYFQPIGSRKRDIR